MKIKYIKENFFDDTELDNLTPEEVVKKDHLFHLVSTIIPEELISKFKNNSYDASYRAPLFPVPNAIGSKYYDRLGRPTRFLHRMLQYIPSSALLAGSKIQIFYLQTHPSIFTQKHYRIDISSKYDNYKQSAYFIIDWIHPDDRVDPHVDDYPLEEIPTVLRNKPASTLYNARNFKATANYLESLVRDIEEIYKKYQIPVSKIELSICINSKILLNYTCKQDYYDYIEQATSFSMKEFENFDQDNITDIARGGWVKINDMLPELSYEPSVSHVIDFFPIHTNN